jgi:hypothetical protein
VKTGVLVLLGGIVLGWVTYSEASVALNSSHEPTEISLGDLIARGPEGNGNIVLTKYVPCANYVITQAGPRPAPSTPWTSVWVPLIPAEEMKANQESPPRPSAPKVLLFSDNIHNVVELEAKLKARRLQARVTNSDFARDGLKPEIRNLLLQAYPGVDLRSCMIIEQGRVPLSKSTLYLMGSAAAACILAGLASMIVCRR